MEPTLAVMSVLTLAQKSEVTMELKLEPEKAQVSGSASVPEKVDSSAWVLARGLDETMEPAMAPVSVLEMDLPSEEAWEETWVSVSAVALALVWGLA